MESWAKAPQGRGQMVLFADRLDEAVGHPVRMLDEILSRIDGSVWEAGYDLTKGQLPIHTRVLASVLLYGTPHEASPRTDESCLDVLHSFPSVFHPCLSVADSLKG